jgi:hypothetical protein
MKRTGTSPRSLRRHRKARKDALLQTLRTETVWRVPLNSDHLHRISELKLCASSRATL